MSGDMRRLTAREREVLQRLAGGQSNGEIASSLSVSTSTVKFHLAAIFAKLVDDDAFVEFLTLPAYERID